jgi:hypothetical protein
MRQLHSAWDGIAKIGMVKIAFVSLAFSANKRISFSGK